MTVAKYPVENSDEEGVVDAVNYLLSGPAGLGQNFSGFSTYVPAYLRPTVRQPFTTPITEVPVALYFFNNISNAVGCDSLGNPTPGVLTPYAKFTFLTPLASAPFQYGDLVDVVGVVDDYPTPPSTTYFDGSYRCWSCTTTEVICYVRNSEYIYPNYISGGQVGANWLNYELDTDCNGRVSVNGPNDRVFVSAQVLADIVYNSTVPNSEFDIVFTITRRTGYVSQAPGSDDFLFAEPYSILAIRRFHYNVTGNGTISDLEAIFTQFIDGPNIPFGYYWYLLTFEFVTKPRYKTSFAIGGVENVSLSGTGINQIVNYPGILPTTVTGTGAGFDLDINIDTTTTTNYDGSVSITINNVGTGYQVGDTLTVPGTSLGGASPANDLTLTVTQIVYPGDATPGIVTLGLRSLTAQVVKQ